MANEVLRKQGTARTWKPSGGDEVLTLTSLANSAGRAGDGHDWGATFARQFIVELLTKFASAPTAGNLVEVWWASSRDGTNYDGGIAAGDAVQSDVNAIQQCYFIGNLRADDDTDAQQQSWIFEMPGRYGFPIVYNRSGQALSGTAGDHTLTMTPLIDEIQ